VEVIRLPGIHHDTSISIVAGTEKSVLIDSGTSWHQVNIVERINSKIELLPRIEAILLTHRHYDTSGAANFLGEKFDAPVFIHPDASNSLVSNDQLTTWASRYDSDMPVTETIPLTDGWEMDLGGGNIQCIYTPGHTNCHSSFFIPELSILFAGDLIPSPEYPGRTDFPTGNIPEMLDSIEKIIVLNPDVIVPSRGKTIRNEEVQKVLQKHRDFFITLKENLGELPENWPKPTTTCMWWSPNPKWE
jgi:hydroxyacylglutathione hydrolase